VILDRAGTPLNGGVNKLLGGREPFHALQHKKLSTTTTVPINTFVFYSSFKVRGLETKDNYLRGAW